MPLKTNLRNKRRVAIIIAKSNINEFATNNSLLTGSY